jgi:hypothetical protein
MAEYTEQLFISALEMSKTPAVHGRKSGGLDAYAYALKRVGCLLHVPTVDAVAVVIPCGGAASAVGGSRILKISSTLSEKIQKSLGKSALYCHRTASLKTIVWWDSNPTSQRGSFEFFTHHKHVPCCRG